MLTGQADLRALAARAATMPSLDAAPVTLAGVEVLQVAFEQRYAVRAAALPAGLHPTTPPLLVLLAWKVPESPWGPFAMAQARVSCRSGVRARAFIAGCVVEGDRAGSALAAGWGLPVAAGAVELVRHYDDVELAVRTAGRTAVSLTGLDPDPLGDDDVQFTVGTALADTPRGLRLVQFEPEYAARRVERLRPRLTGFDAEAWGEPHLAPYHPVVGAVALADVTIPSLRFLSRPDVSAFEGTERV